MNPALWLARTAIRTPEAPAIFHGTDLVLTYAGFDRQSAAIGAGLCARGIGPGERVALFLPNSPEVLPILFGIWYAGATAVPINAKLHPKEVDYILGASGARLAFVVDKTAHDVDLPLIEPGSGAFAALTGTDPLPAPAVTAPDDTLWLFYTSGTTGKPKGACQTGANLTAMSLAYLADVDRVTAGWSMSSWARGT